VKVTVTDKLYFAAAKAIDLVVEEAAYERGEGMHADGSAVTMARVLFRDGPRALPAADFHSLLDHFVSFVRAKHRKGTRITLEELLSTIDDLRLRARRRTVQDILGELWRDKDYLRAFVEGGAYTTVSLDPLVPSLMPAIIAWHGQHHRPLRLIHDRYSLLTPEATSDLVFLANNPFPEFLYGAPLVEVVQVDSRDDPRVQVADIVAGLARAIATDALNGPLDERVAAVARSIVIPRSVWGDDTSWERLTGNGNFG